MLAALLLLGILPFAAMPALQGAGWMGGDEPEDDAELHEATETFVGVDAPDDAADEEAGTAYSFDATPGTTVIENFQPGIDSIEMDLTAIQGEVLFDSVGSANEATLSFSVGEETVSTMVFPGLADVPAGDIFLTLTDDVTGEPFETSLSDAVAAASAEVLDPVDPDLPDTPGPNVIDEPPLSPTDPDNPDPVGPDIPDGRPVLEPLDPDQEFILNDNSSVLDSALPRDGESTGGLGDAVPGASEAGMIEAQLGSGEETFAVSGDGVNETAGLVVEGTAVLTSDAPTDVIAGGAGDDTIYAESESEAAFAFGGDTLSGGDGDGVIDHADNLLAREGVTQNGFAWRVDGAEDVPGGGAGNDTLIPGNGDVATDGTGNDLFWVYTDGDDGAAAAEVMDFRVGEDFLRISLNPQIGENGEPDVLVVASDDGADGLVMVNGDLVAILSGAPGATASDVYAEVKPDVFA